MVRVRPAGPVSLGLFYVRVIFVAHVDNFTWVIFKEKLQAIFGLAVFAVEVAKGGRVERRLECVCAGACAFRREMAG